MHLKTLTLRGFKSFAASTSLVFEPGVNCVVGPNGSGKSNIVDALAWVMGEQGAKNLRGGNMADVVFAGTSKRPALGRAEVCLTIDNSDGALPIDYAEVTISRTLFRSGGSEYAINGTACRLLDVQELLSEAGMGREMHVIVGQGRLDEVLKATPEDRRGFVEEAAGVLKHRRRKDKALRKLESMRESFTRIEDLSAELRRQLGPLAKQAEAARRAQVLQATVRDARARLLADGLAQQQARMESQNVDETNAAARREEARQRILRVRRQLEGLEEAAARANPELARLGDQWDRVGSLEERFRSLGRIAAERHRSLAVARPFHADRPEDLRERASKARREEDELTGRLTRARDELTEAISIRERHEQAERTAEREHAELTRAMAERREEDARLAGRTAAASGRVEALEAERARAIQTLEGVRQRAAEAADQCAELEREEVAETKDDGLTAAHEAAAAVLADARGALETARDRARQAATRHASWEAKAETLALSLAPQDATAWALDGADGVKGLARDFLNVADGWEGAVEAALGEAARGLVVESVDDAVDALRGARRASAGRLHLVVASEVRDGEGTEAEEERLRDALVGTTGEAVAAVDVVEAKGEGGKALLRMLTGVGLASNLDVACELARAGVRAATPAGDLIAPAQATGGEASTASVLARQAAYDEARGRAADAREDRARADGEVDRASCAVQEAMRAYERSGAELAARDSRLASATARLGLLRESLAAARGEEERAVERVQAIEADLAQRRQALAALRLRRQAWQTEPADLAERLEAAARAALTAHEETVRARQAETEAKLRLRTNEERLRAIAGRADALARRAEDLAERMEREAKAAARRAQAAHLAERIGRWAARALAVAQEIRADIARARQEAREARRARDLELNETRRLLDEALAQARDLDDVAHRQELARAEIRMRYEQLASRAVDELGLDAQTLIDEFGPHVPVPVASGPAVPYVRDEQKRRLARAERDLERLGTINPLALEEYAALEERRRYLSDQLADLRKSRRDLLAIVEDLDERVERVLSSALEDVGARFAEVFARLFPGGEGRLVVTDPQDVLTTGVDIEARPPGKQVKRLSLLSGGERSLTAIAFLVAIFMARPSPFYVMDEVEAALDDVNLSRLIDVFADLRSSSQLLIVTHQKRTMEIADTLYGVTMREDGVSTVLSQRMRDIKPTTQR